LFAIIKQTEIDTTASILAILDGISSLPDYAGDFRLYAESNRKNLCGDLSNLFWKLMRWRDVDNKSV
jgi:hypothetical protein